ncbi:GHMP family kinase ATP-binding protein [Halanaerobacter jeridensis]|uniref:L-threonine kinase n=1 Tax=Halanaerobacter jeridensis TaxID=706427 RepID=A0A938XT88_9FIRM|nr:kinase [Halanaerobacter jeridensis]MBM7557110.1 L-threonine kinase [Halanaerobacter jeridensis]
MRKKVTVKVPGTCGELMQGIIAGVNLQISCPIDLYSTVTMTRIDSEAGIKIKEEAEKTKLAIEKTLDYYNYDLQNLGLQVDLQSELLVGKGMASSTADIVASIIATMTILGVEVDIKIVQEIAVSIEATDGCFLSGLTAFNHLQGQQLAKLGSVKTPLPLLIFDCGGTINTTQFNAQADLARLKLAKEKQAKQAYQLIVRGIKEGNNRLIGQGATLSSQANQSILYKPQLTKILQVVEAEKKVLGINIAHSGTLIGVLLNSKDKLGEIKENISSQITDIDYVTNTKLINGGYEIRR